jgi:hypothetical protein
VPENSGRKFRKAFAGLLDSGVGSRLWEFKRRIRLHSVYRILLSVVVLALSALLPFSEASAGQIIYENLYSPQTLVQGWGLSVDEAREDAMHAIPRQDGKELYKPDPKNPAVFGCIIAGRPDEAGRCDTRIAGNRIHYTIPLITPKERAPGSSSPPFAN